MSGPTAQDGSPLKFWAAAKLAAATIAKIGAFMIWNYERFNLMTWNCVVGKNDCVKGEVCICGMRINKYSGAQLGQGCLVVWADLAFLSVRGVV